MKQYVFALLAILLLVSCAVATSDGLSTTADSDEEDVPEAPDLALKYFDETLVPLIRTSSSCASCHALPKDGGVATTAIFRYGYMRPLLVAGAVTVSRSTVDNGVMRYFLGQVPTHASGFAMCGANTFNLSPCKEMVEWAKLEGLKDALIAPPDPGGGSGPATPATIGRVSAGSVDGVLYGWAADSDTPSTPMTVEFYVNGPRGSGTSAGTLVANLVSYSWEKSGNVAYRFTLPDSYRNGVAHPVYVYGRDNNTPGVYHELTGSPLNVTAYAPDAAAKTYYTNNVVPFVTNRCLGCHSSGEFAYDLALYSLILNPAPYNGGSSINNTFYRKMMGLDSHRGGAPCGGNASAMPCNHLTQTWALQFD